MKKIQKQPPELLYKKTVAKKLANSQNSTSKSLFNSKYCKIFKSTYFEEHLRTAASENVFMKLRKNKDCSWGIFNFILRKEVKIFVFISWKKQVKMLLFISRLVSVGVFIQYFCNMVRNKLQPMNIYLS